MKRFFYAVACALLLSFSGFTAEVFADASGSLSDQAMVDSRDIEVINDLDILQNWDDVQSEQALDNNAVDGQETTGVSHDQ